MLNLREVRDVVGGACIVTKHVKPHNFHPAAPKGFYRIGYIPSHHECIPVEKATTKELIAFKKRAIKEMKKSIKRLEETL